MTDLLDLSIIDLAERVRTGRVSAEQATRESLLPYYGVIGGRRISGHSDLYRVDTVMEQCGLTDVAKRIIGQLSKGYRQRVGLADALVHEPDLIILDEPTIGLDPHQIRSVRQLIQSLAQRHTVLISSHILPEVEMTCSRVLIMFEGRIVAADTPEALQQKMSANGQIIAEIAAPATELHDIWMTVPEIEYFDMAQVDGGYQRCAFTTRDGADLRPMIFETARRRGWALRELSRSRLTLEDVYVQATRTDEEDEV